MIARDADNEATMISSLDALFADDDNVRIQDDSDSDGYLSEVKIHTYLCNVSLNVKNKFCRLDFSYNYNMIGPKQ